MTVAWSQQAAGSGSAAANQVSPCMDWSWPPANYAPRPTNHGRPAVNLHRRAAGKAELVGEEVARKAEKGGREGRLGRRRGRRGEVSVRGRGEGQREQSGAWGDGLFCSPPMAQNSQRTYARSGWEH